MPKQEWELDFDEAFRRLHDPDLVLKPKIKALISSLLEQTRRETLEEIEKWAFDNGITHKESFTALVKKLKDLSQ